MRKILFILAICFCGNQLFAQIQNPVHWSYGTKKISDGLYQVHLKATIDDGWHLYSQTQPSNAVAKPTSFLFKNDESYRLMDKPKEVGKLERYFSPSIGAAANQYTNTVDFVQVIKLNGKAPATVTGTITYQTCTDKMCLPPAELPFSVNIR